MPPFIQSLFTSSVLRSMSAACGFIPALCAAFFMVSGFASLTPAAHAQSDDEPEPSERAAKVLKDYNRTGDYRLCLNLRRIDQIKPLDARYFLVRATGGERYLNIVTKGCRGASRRRNRLQYTTSTGRLCANEIVNVVENVNGVLYGSCALGSFERLDPIETDESTN